MSASSAKNYQARIHRIKPAGASAGPSAAVMPTYARANLVFERGEGAWLVATSGERYLDFASGVAVNALGHAHPKLVAALTEQASKVWHTSNLYRVAGQERLAERLCEVTFADQVFFCNSGAEACEGAIKLARRYHYVNGRPERWRHGHLQGRLPRPHARHHRLGGQRQAPGRLRASGRRLRHGARSAISRPRRRPSARTRPASWSSRCRARAACTSPQRLAQGAARAVRQARTAAGARRGADRHGPHRQAVRLRMGRHHA